VTTGGTGETVFRRWCAMATALAALFVVYGSLVPFHFVGPYGARHAVNVLLASWPIEGNSHSDFLANICLYIPIGFFGGGLLVQRRSGLVAWILTIVALLIFALALSVSVELLQVFLPGRTSALSDVAAALAGTVGGFAGWFLLSGDVARWIDQWAVGQRGGVLRVMLAVYSIGLILLILWPLDITLDLGGLAHKVRTGGIVLNPLRSPLFDANDLPTLLMDLLFAVPVGVWVSLVGARGRRRAVWPAAAMGIALFGVVEAAQVPILSCRADALEFLMNAAGAVAGVLLTAAVVPVVDDRRFLARAQSSRTFALVGLVAALLFYAVYNLSPFNFLLSPEFIRGRIGGLVGIPFWGYYINPQFKALDDALIKISLGVPIGLFLQLCLGRRMGSLERVASVAAVFLTTIFLTAIEFGQVLLPTRYPDDSDIILAVIGVVLAMWLVRALTIKGTEIEVPRTWRRSSRRRRRRVELPTKQDR
jgi:VanZ family protein